MIVIKISVCVFFAIVFIQSGLDKIVNWKDNLSWLKEYFGKSPLKNLVPQMLGVTALLEVGAGLLSALGAVAIPLLGNPSLAQIGLCLSNVSLLCLFFGQRMAKDYAGAAALVPYFILSLLGLYFVSIQRFV